MEVDVFTNEKFFWFEWEKWYFWICEKNYDFCTKNDNSKSSKYKKNFHTMKKFKISAFKRYEIFHSDSRNDKDMVKTKKIPESGDFFVSKCNWLDDERQMLVW